MAFNLADLFERVADAVGEREAIVSAGVRQTYRDLDRRAAGLAAAMGAAGLGPGHSVALALGNRVECVEVVLAAFKAGAVPVNLNRQFVLEELRAVLDDARPSLVVADPERAELVGLAAGPSCQVWSPGAAHEARATGPAQPRRERSGDDEYIIYTSGTSGRPRGVVWRHEDLFFAALGGGNLGGAPIGSPAEIVAHVAPHPGRTLIASPLTHGTAQWAALAALLGGNTLLLSGTPGFDAEVVLDLAAGERASHLVLVGDAYAIPLLEALDAHPGRWDLDGLVVVASGGAPLSSDGAARLLEHLPGALVSDGYGSSESGGQGRRVLVPGSVGGSLPAFQMSSDTRVVDEEWRELTPGSDQVGQIVRVGRVPLRYTADRPGDRAAFATRAGERWVLTDDLGRVEADGTVTLLGRRARVINTGGEKVHPAEVEAVLRTHPGVRDVVVVGVADLRFGEAVAAVVEAVRGESPARLERDALRAHCRPMLAPFKLPRSVVVVDRLDRLASGKIDVAAARARAEEAGAARGDEPAAGPDAAPAAPASPSE